MEQTPRITIHRFLLNDAFSTKIGIDTQMLSVDLSVANVENLRHRRWLGYLKRNNYRSLCSPETNDGQ